ncbi:hypothetical protein AGMMS49942_15660 [Spirochaetia bacterium]|nr:hypothetical protein AGMMS49942_15660 [Spirochaetia bacterium]
MTHWEKGNQPSTAVSFLTVITKPVLRGPAIRCIASILRNFFFLQHRAILRPGRIPVSEVEHPLDEGIPFIPRWVDIYQDFSPFWIRIVGFLLHRYRRRALAPVKDFINSMNRIYSVAAEVYAKNLSTTRRPFYIRNPQFLLIHLLDPHLMCIPSIHVMVMIFSYTHFREILRSFGDESSLAAEINEVCSGAVRITEAILYVKQHSVNCVAASMYTMSRFDPGLFPPVEAEAFVSRLFVEPEGFPADDGARIREHIITLYRYFMDRSRPDEPWDAPLLDFLRERRK